MLLLDGKLLLTVTDADADPAGQPPPQLASAWADTLNRAFRQALRERRPAYLRWAWERAALLIVVGLGLHFLIGLLARRIDRRTGWPAPLLLWLLIGWRIIDLFPQTRPLEILLLAGPLRSVTLCVVIGLPAAALVRVWGITLRRLFPPIPEDLSSQERTERTFQRRVTLARVAEVAGATLIWITALLTMATWLGVNLSALLTSAGLIGVALGFVAQDALRDFVASLYILADDRFGVGDTIQVGAYEGRVERLNLRATQLRDISGRLITISNRGITEVANLTARWAQVDFKVGVSYYEDLDKAQETLITDGAGAGRRMAGTGFGPAGAARCGRVHRPQCHAAPDDPHTARRPMGRRPRTAPPRQAGLRCRRDHPPQQPLCPACGPDARPIVSYR